MSFHSAAVKRFASGIMRKSLAFAGLCDKSGRCTCFNHSQMSDLQPPLTTVRHLKRIELNVNTFYFRSKYPAMNQQATASQKSRAEQETENEANRLREQVDAALAAVISRSPDEIDSLQSAADRIERAARDLGDALRELARQRRTPDL